MAVGSVPLVDHVPELEPLYRGLPVVMVKDWTAVNASFLRHTALLLHNSDIAPSAAYDRVAVVTAGRSKSVGLSKAKAFLPYWIDSLYGGNGQLLSQLPIT